MRAIPSVSITRNAYKESYRNRCLTDYCQSTDDTIRQLHRISLSIDEVSDAQYLTSGNETLKSFPKIIKNKRTNAFRFQTIVIAFEVIKSL